MLPKVVDARYAGDDRVWLRFADGLTGEIDLAAELWGSVFEPVKDKTEFAKLRADCDLDTIVWPNGADLSPEWLWKQVKCARTHHRGSPMPEICRFLGIIIAMYHREHGVPHFHVTYGEYDATIDVITGKVLAGRLPRRVLKLVRDWRELHLDELTENVRLAAARKPLNKIDPLE